MSEHATKELVERLMNLPYEDRKAIADRLNESLHPEREALSFEEWRAAWIPELDRRAAASDDGSEPSLPIEQLWSRIDGKHE